MGKTVMLNKIKRLLDEDYLVVYMDLSTSQTYQRNNVLSNFLSRMVHLGIIESTGNKNSGTYIFTNRLYYVYFLVKSINLWVKLNYFVLSQLNPKLCE